MGFGILENPVWTRDQRTKTSWSRNQDHEEIEILDWTGCPSIPGWDFHFACASSCLGSRMPVTKLNWTNENGKSSFPQGLFYNQTDVCG